MKILKFDVLASTNLYLKSLVKNTTVEDFTIINSVHQTHGKGQRGTNWTTQPGKNLTFSVYKNHQNLAIEQQFVLNKAVSLAIYQVLCDLNIPNLKIKWPNDIVSANQKIGGILIENTIQSKYITSSIIGIGLNVNQTSFDNLPQASSLKNITGKTYNLDQVLHSIIKELEVLLKYLEEGRFGVLHQKYLKALYRLGLVSTFQNINKHYFMGQIKTVDEQGLLVIALDSGKLKTFDLKQIKLMH